MFPTHPVVEMNFFEKLYTIKQLKKLREFEEDEYDPDKKELGEAARWAWFEKRMLMGILLFSTIGWFSFARHFV